MAIFDRSRLRAALPDLPLALKSILGFWCFYYLTIAARIILLEGRAPFDHRVFAIFVGMLLTFGLYLVLSRVARSSLRLRIIVAVVACLVPSALFSALNTALALNQPFVTQMVHEERGPNGTVITRAPNGDIKVVRRGGEAVTVKMPPLRSVMLQQAPKLFADGTVTWYFFFAAWASFYIALSSATQLRVAERRAAEFERDAQAAQLRALRYQVNPHFLFNTLNSLSSLIMARRDEEAEAMIVNLSTFFRSTLAVDPTADVTLTEEIGFQMLYLDIEKVRFPRRLKVEVDVPDGLGAARVPALILQPVIENAIKYGVSRARGAVIVSVRAREEGGRLHLQVENKGDIPPSYGERRGTGVGLANVCERLSARFGADATCSHGPVDGGFRVDMTMPLLSDG
jgi:hypothetical protein